MRTHDMLEDRHAQDGLRLREIIQISLDDISDMDLEAEMPGQLGDFGVDFHSIGTFTEMDEIVPESAPDFRDALVVQTVPIDES